MQQKQPTDTEYESTDIVTLDVETGGEKPGKHPLMAIGACRMDLKTGVVKDRFQIFLEEGDLEIDPQCWKDFWSKHEDVLKFIRKNAIDFDTGIRAFVSWLDKIDAQHPNIILASDTTGFDNAWINWALGTVGRLPIEYRLGRPERKYYRRVVHINSMGKILAGWPVVSDWRKALADKGCELPPRKGATHYPLDDAIYMAGVLRAIILFRHRKKE